MSQVLWQQRAPERSNFALRATLDVGSKNKAPLPAVASAKAGADNKEIGQKATWQSPLRQLAEPGFKVAGAEVQYSRNKAQHAILEEEAFIYA